jgi:hypothetical protein
MSNDRRPLVLVGDDDVLRRDGEPVGRLLRTIGEWRVVDLSGGEVAAGPRLGPVLDAARVMLRAVPDPRPVSDIRRLAARLFGRGAPTGTSYHRSARRP